MGNEGRGARRLGGASPEARAGRAGPHPTRRRATIRFAFVWWLVAAGCQTAGPTPAPDPAGSAATPAAAFPLGGTTWRADEIEGQRAEDRVASTITFEGAQRVVGSTGCNRYVASLAVTGTALRVGEIATTRRACPPAEMDQERRFVDALATVRTYRQDGDTLWLLDERGRTLLRLTRSRSGAARPTPAGGGETGTLAAYAVEGPDGPRLVARRSPRARS